MRAIASSRLIGGRSDVSLKICLAPCGITIKSPAESLGLLAPDVSDAVLLEAMLEHPVATMIERDDKIPPLPELIAELDHARAVGSDARGKVLA